MIPRTAKIIRSPGVAAVIITAALAGPRLAPAAPPAPASLALRRVSRLVRSYARVTRIHCVAVSSGHFTVTPKMARYAKSGRFANSYEFWGDRKLYRINFVFKHPRGFSSEDFEAAYDGRRYQYLDLTSRALSVSRSRPSRKKMLPAALNPLMAFLVFMEPQPPGPQARPIDFSEVLARPGRVIRKAHLLSAKVSSKGRLVAQFPGGRLQGRPVVYTVIFRRTAPRFLPTRIELGPKGGASLLIYTFSKYRTVRVGSSRSYLPQGFRTAVYGKHGVLVAAIRTEIVYRSINKPLRPDTFTINSKLGSEVHDNGRH